MIKKLRPLLPQKITSRIPAKFPYPKQKKCSHTRVHPPHAHFIFVACCLISVVSMHEHPVGGGGFAKYYNDIHSGGEISAHVIRLVNTIFISTHWSG